MNGPAAPLLVLGAGGRVGRRLRSVWPVAIPARWHSRRPQSGCEHCDLLSEPDQLARMADGCAAILCLAGVTDRSHGKNGAAYDENSRLAQAAIIAAQRSGCPRVLLSSSAAVYGRAGGVLFEGNTGKDLSRYGLAKREMEEVGTALAEATCVNVCSLRIGNIAGADAILGGWHLGFALDVFDDGRTPQRSYLGFRVLADIVQDLMIAANLPPALNVAQPGLMAMGDLLDAAGLPWRKRKAQADAIKTVHLSTNLLERTLKRPVPGASPDTLAEEWRLMEAAPAGAE